MALIKIFYYQTDGDFNSYEDIIKSSLPLEGVGFEPVSLFNEVNCSSIYYDCPSWGHRAKRTFIVRSPIDLSISVNKKEKSIWVDNINQNQFDSWFAPTFLESNWCSDEKITLQLAIPRIFFWTEAKNIWIENKPDPYTSINNNFVTVSGWFNLSSWTRPLSFAFDVVDHNKKIIIRRGNPIYRLSFYSNDMNDSFKLIKKHIDKKLFDQIHRRINAKDYSSNLLNNLLFEKQKLKCPFSSLWGERIK